MCCSSVEQHNNALFEEAPFELQMHPPRVHGVAPQLLDPPRPAPRGLTGPPQVVLPQETATAALNLLERLEARCCDRLVAGTLKMLSALGGEIGMLSRMADGEVTVSQPNAHPCQPSPPRPPPPPQSPPQAAPPSCPRPTTSLCPLQPLLLPGPPVSVRPVFRAMTVGARQPKLGFLAGARPGGFA